MESRYRIDDTRTPYARTARQTNIHSSTVAQYGFFLLYYIMCKWERAGITPKQLSYLRNPAFTPLNSSEHPYVGIIRIRFTRV